MRFSFPSRADLIFLGMGLRAIMVHSAFVVFRLFTSPPVARTTRDRFMRFVRLLVSRTFVSLNVCRLVAAGICSLGVMLAGGDASTEEPLDLQQGNVVAFDQFDYPLGSLLEGDGGSGWKQPWKTSRQTAPNVVESSVSTPENLGHTLTGRAMRIRGTSARNNPLRRALAKPMSQQEVFVRFNLQYRGIETSAAKVGP